jgi:hypothetical protein
MSPTSLEIARNTNTETNVPKIRLYAWLLWWLLNLWYTGEGAVRPACTILGYR